jgi:DNA mismatch repair protein MutS
MIALLAQAGSYVPAEAAHVGLVDRLFTRVGAADRLGAGQSTFLVEMLETAEILRSATPRSLVLLDEVGRGTATYDGLALAWAVTEHLHAAHGPRPRTLFATHYHELTQLAESLPRLANIHVEVREWGDQVVFLHQVVPGPADRSYGIHVAQMAGLPPAVVERAREVLGELETERTAQHLAAKPRAGERRAAGAVQGQLPLFPPEALALLQALGAAEPERMSPLQALTLLAEWKERWGK